MREGIHVGLKKMKKNLRIFIKKFEKKNFDLYIYIYIYLVFGLIWDCRHFK